MAKKPHKDPKFTERLEIARAALGFHYPILLKAKFPNHTTNKIRNVVYNGTTDWPMLKDMEKVAGIKRVKKDIELKAIEL